MTVRIISYVKQFFDCGHRVPEFDRQLIVMPTKVTCAKSIQHTLMTVPLIRLQ